MRTKEERAKRIAELEKQASAIHDELFELQLEAVRAGDLALTEDDCRGGCRVDRRG